jgi:hypothetical protein
MLFLFTFGCCFMEDVISSDAREGICNLFNRTHQTHWYSFLFLISFSFRFHFFFLISFCHPVWILSEECLLAYCSILLYMQWNQYLCRISVLLEKVACFVSRALALLQITNILRETARSEGLQCSCSKSPRCVQCVYCLRNYYCLKVAHFCLY